MSRKNTIMVGLLASIDDLVKTERKVVNEVRALEKEGYELVGPIQVAITDHLVNFAATMTLVKE